MTTATMTEGQTRNQHESQTDPLVDRRRLHGFMAEFATVALLVAAARRSRMEGYRQVEAYAPFPVEELAEALELRPSRIPWVMLGGGIAGALAGYGMQYYAMVISYPMNIGGRPLHAWPAFIPVTFELTILFAVLGGLAALFFTLGFPAVYHPVFNHPDFRRASRNGFFLCIESGDELFDVERTPEFLRMLQPMSVQAVEK